MHIIRAGADRATQRRTDTFTGAVLADPVLGAADGADGIVVNDVVFTPGARTHWHSHERGQVLHVTVGRGWICTRGEQPRQLAAGDTVWVPAGETHWHGGSAGTVMAHRAISLGVTTWLDPVAEHEYPTDPLSEGQPS